MKFLKFSLFLTIMTLFGCSNGKVPKTPISTFRYSVHGSRSGAICKVDIERVDDKTCIVSYLSRDGHKKYDSISCDAKLLDEVREVVMEKKMWKYKDHYTPKQKILDGSSWSLSISFMDDEDYDYHISTGGYMASPNDGGTEAIMKIVKKYVERSATEMSSPLQYYEYRENGTMAQPNCDFKIERVDDKTCSVRYFNHKKKMGVVNGHYDYDSMYDTIKLPIAVLDSVRDVVVAKKMLEYENHYMPPTTVLDGTTWSLCLKFVDGRYVSSSGSNAWPQGRGMNAVEEIMMNHCEGLCY